MMKPSQKSSTNMTGTLPKETLPINHVYPKNDDRKHRLDSSGQCWCKPKRTDITDGKKVIGVRISHNSADEREFVEERLGELLDEDKTWGTKLIS